ncbi:hypothetical protein HK099_000664, partial [Clydaea vesicula]
MSTTGQKSKLKRKSRASLAIFDDASEHIIQDPINFELKMTKQKFEENLILELELLRDTYKIEELIDRIYYSRRYKDEDNVEHRHVILPKELYNIIPDQYKNRILSEMEWRGLGIRQSPGWIHYCTHNPEPYIFLFKRTETEKETFDFIEEKTLSSPMINKRRRSFKNDSRETETSSNVLTETQISPNSPKHSKENDENIEIPERPSKDNSGKKSITKEKVMLKNDVEKLRKKSKLSVPPEGLNININML